MGLLKLATARIRVFSFVGVSLTSLSVTISKNGGAFAAVHGAGLANITGNFYSVTLDSTDTNTLGDLAYKFSDTVIGVVVPNGDDVDQVLAALPGNPDMPVTLADGVAHGGTIGSSTATLALQQVDVTNPGGPGLSVTAGAGNAGASITGGGVGVSVSSTDPGATAVLISGDGGGVGIAAFGVGSNGLDIQGDLKGVNIFGNGAGSVGIFVEAGLSGISAIGGTGPALQLGDGASGAEGLKISAGPNGGNSNAVTIDANAGSGAGIVIDTSTGGGIGVFVASGADAVDLVVAGAAGNALLLQAGATGGFAVGAGASGDCIDIEPGTGVAVSVAGNIGVDAIGRHRILSSLTANKALNAFEFVMTNLLGVPTAGLAVSCQVSIDGAAYVASANAPTGISNGRYKIDLAPADLNGTVVGLRFTAAGASDLNLTLIMTP